MYDFLKILDEVHCAASSAILRPMEEWVNTCTWCTRGNPEGRGYCHFSVLSRFFFSPSPSYRRCCPLNPHMQRHSRSPDVHHLQASGYRTECRVSHFTLRPLVSFIFLYFIFCFPSDTSIETSTVDPFFDSALSTSPNSQVVKCINVRALLFSFL